MRASPRPLPEGFRTLLRLYDKETIIMKIYHLLATALLLAPSSLLAQGFGGQSSGAGAAPPSPASSTRTPAPTSYRMDPALAKRYGLPSTPQVAPGSYAAAGMAAPEEPAFSITFKGGTASELIEQLRKALGTPPNVLISPAMQDVMLPAFELHNVTFNDLFQALNNLSGPNQKGQWQLSGSSQPIWVLNPASSAGVDPVTGAPFGYSTPSAPANRTCQIFPIDEYLGQFKVEDITTAIQTAWTMLGDDAGAQMKLHKDTNLLIAVGTSEQLSIINQVLTSLGRALHPHQNNPAADTPAPTKPTPNPKPDQPKF